MKKLLLLALLLGLFIAFFAFDLGQYLSLEYFSARKAELESLRDAHFGAMAAAYFLLYLLVFALALPAGAVLTLVGGAIFGLWWGVLLVSFASTAGSTLAFLAARYLLRNTVEQRFGDRLETLNRGIAREGGFYLFTLRLVPLFPPALINLAMALTSMRTWTFYWVSQLGMLAGTIVYVNAGVQLGQLDAGQPILSAGLIFAFVLLGVFPLLARRALDWLRARRVYRGYSRPKRFDTNLLVIGAGSGGLVSAYIAAAVRARVTLVERERMGGDCLNTGCVPSKTLLRSAKIAHYVDSAERFGLRNASAEVDFAAVMARVRAAIATIEPHDSVERYTGLGVDCVQGNARLVSPFEVDVDGQRITARNIVIATGGRPAVPALPGLDKINYFTSDTIWNLEEQPTHLLVVGGGPIGCELAQAFARLGSQVTVLTRGPRLLSREDDDASDVVSASLRDDGLTLLFEHQLQSFERSDAGITVTASHGNASRSIECSHVLFATGRQANTAELGLESLGIETRADGTIEVDDYLRTRFPNIYAVGDVTGPYQFTHVASHQAWYAAVNALFGRFKTFRVDYSVIPWATFTDPEVARVGLSEAEATRDGIAYEVTRYPLDDLDRAIADGQTAGFVKVLTPPGSDRVLGATIVGYHAAELLNEFVVTMKRGGKLGDILGTIHIYPTLGEANKFAAGNWRKAHQPERLLAFAERFHRWQRGG